jgi:hypothetical protein
MRKIVSKNSCIGRCGCLTEEHQFIKGQTHFGMPRVAKMSLALTEPKSIDLSSKVKHYLQGCTTSVQKLLILYAKQPMKNHKAPTPDKKPH